jgi:uncharacterized membrane protein
MATQSRIEGVTAKNVELISKMEHSSINSRTTAEWIADVVADWVGSWTFVVLQSVLLLIWLLLNVQIFWKPWDPYPFVLLNLVLSFQAAFATPVILMSQNRQARLADRRNQLDLQINLLAEQENTQQLRLLRLLCQKVGVDLRETDGDLLEEPIDPGVIVQQIVEHTKTTEPINSHSM